MTIGIVKDVTNPNYIKIQAKEPLPLGKYVSIDRDDGKCLGLVETSESSSSTIKDISNFDEAIESVDVSKDNTRDKGYETTVRVIGTIESLKSHSPKLPFTPTIPGTTISNVDNAVLESIFSPNDDEFSRIGNLLREDNINVKINLDEIFSRHLAILAMTGMGKSNFVTVLAREIGKIEGTCVIFDYHNDYGGLELKDDNGKKISVNHVDAKIAPQDLTGDQFAKLIDIPKGAIHQIDILTHFFEINKNNSAFWDSIVDAVRGVTTAVELPPDLIPRGDHPTSEENRVRNAARSLFTRLERARRLYSSVIDPNVKRPQDSLKQYAINILNATELNEKQADLALAHYLETIFSDRKHASKKDLKDVIFEDPVFFIIEEAHTFIKKAERDEETETKYVAAKIAKEARKYALGLGIVSQRPSKIDEDILSQMGSFAVLKMIQKRDQDSICNTSEEITEKMASQLSSLNVGEAFLSGRFVKVPTLVKIDEISEEEKKFGKDISATQSFARAKKMRITQSSQGLVDKEDL